MFGTKIPKPVNVELGKGASVSEVDTDEVVAGDPPRTVESLRAEIMRQYDNASRRMKQVASFVLDKPEDVAFETLAVVADRAGVQPSTIVRYAKTLGYPGASQMQKIIRDELLASHISLAYGERARHFSETAGVGGDSS